MAKATTCAYKPSPFFVKVGSGFLTFDHLSKTSIRECRDMFTNSSNNQVCFEQIIRCGSYVCRREGVQQGQARRMSHFEMHMLYQELCASHENNCSKYQRAGNYWIIAKVQGFRKESSRCKEHHCSVRNQLM